MAQGSSMWWALMRLILLSSRSSWNPPVVFTLPWKGAQGIPASQSEPRNSKETAALSDGGEGSQSRDWLPGSNPHSPGHPDSLWGEDSNVKESAQGSEVAGGPTRTTARAWPPGLPPPPQGSGEQKSQPVLPGRWWVCSLLPSTQSPSLLLAGGPLAQMALEFTVHLSQAHR